MRLLRTADNVLNWRVLLAKLVSNDCDFGTWLNQTCIYWSGLNDLSIVFLLSLLGKCLIF